MRSESNRIVSERNRELESRGLGSVQEISIERNLEFTSSQQIRNISNEVKE